MRGVRVEDVREVRGGCYSMGSRHEKLRMCMCASVVSVPEPKPTPVMHNNKGLFRNETSSSCNVPALYPGS